MQLVVCPDARRVRPTSRGGRAAHGPVFLLHLRPGENWFSDPSFRGYSPVLSPSVGPQELASLGASGLLSVGQFLTTSCNKKWVPSCASKNKSDRLLSESRFLPFEESSRKDSQRRPDFNSVLSGSSPAL